MKKRLLIVNTVLLVLLSGLLPASWMGETWLWVQVEQIGPYKYGEKKRQATLYVIHWGRGAGHGDGYGKTFPGTKKKVELLFADEASAASVNNGHTAWVKHRAASYFVQGQSGSSSSWRYLGDMAQKAHPLTVVKAPEILPDSGSVSLLFSVQKNQKVALKVRYKTLGNYWPRFRLFWNKTTYHSSKQAITMDLVYDFPDLRHSGSNSRVEDDSLLQFDFSPFAGKIIHIRSNGKRLVSFNL